MTLTNRIAVIPGPIVSAGTGNPALLIIWIPVCTGMTDKLDLDYRLWETINPNPVDRRPGLLFNG